MTTIPTGTHSTPVPLARIAASSSFYTAMRVLPRDRRDAMHAIYAFCRAVDDIADDRDRASADRASELARWREGIDAIYDGLPPDFVAPLIVPVARFGLRRSDFLAVIDGMDMDVARDIQAPDDNELDLYCDRVASAVGRLSVKIFGLPDGLGIPLAHHLGRALQLTNILRDLDEDAAMNRLYLPRQTLQAVGIFETDPARVLAHPKLHDACLRIAARAQTHFDNARDIMARGKRPEMRCPHIMADVYGALLEKLVDRGWSGPRPRVPTPKLRALVAMLRYGII